MEIKIIINNNNSQNIRPFYMKRREKSEMGHFQLKPGKNLYFPILVPFSVKLKVTEYGRPNCPGARSVMV
jgi:hypothetical protein